MSIFKNIGGKMTKLEDIKYLHEKGWTKKEICKILEICTCETKSVFPLVGCVSVAPTTSDINPHVQPYTNNTYYTDGKCRECGGY
tara:strand:- start:1401 stop:1655 length:255 start_codon:yes stop_codon:yes gene_type:complete